MAPLFCAYDSNVINASFDEVVIVLDELVSGQAYQQVDHRYLNGPAIDQVFADETPGDSVLWYLSDQQQTVRDVAKFTTITAGAQATVRNHLEYDSFGNVTSADDPTTGTANDGDVPGLEGVGNEYSPQRSYTGREPDPAIGLIYYRARWYDAQVGRFISEDPIGFAAGDANLSRYVGNSTPNAVDPSGLDYLEKEGNIAVWVIEDETANSFDGWEVGRIDLGVIDGDFVHLRPRFGGGTVPYSRLAEYVARYGGIGHPSLYSPYGSLNELSEDQRDWFIQFWISEANFRAGNSCLRAGDRGDEDGNVTSYAGANGPIAAALILQMVRQIATDLAMEFGGGKALSVISHGGKLIFKQGKKVIELSAEEIAKKLGKKVDEIDLNAIAKKLDGKIDDLCDVPAAEAPKRRGGEPGFKSSQQRKQLEGLKNSLKSRLKGKQREAFKKAIESEKIGEQFLDKQTLQEIFDDIVENVKP